MKFLEAKRLKAEGENKALGGPKEDKASRSSSSASPSAPAGPQASPQARTLAREQGIDLASLKGTGAGGVITVGDVNKAMEAKSESRGSAADFASGGGIGRD